MVGVYLSYLFDRSSLRVTTVVVQSLVKNEFPLGVLLWKFRVHLLVDPVGLAEVRSEGAPFQTVFLFLHSLLLLPVLQARLLCLRLIIQIIKHVPRFPKSSSWCHIIVIERRGKGTIRIGLLLFPKLLLSHFLLQYLSFAYQYIFILDLSMRVTTSYFYCLCQFLQAVGRNS